MNGEPFDEGIKSLSEDVLVELTMLLDLKVAMLVRKEMVRALRQAWSEGNTGFRLTIVNYLDQMNVKVSKSKEHDKVTHIVSLLDEHEHNKEEEQQILSAFIDTQFHKISEDKIANKLNYIRQQKRMKLWEKKLDISFNSLSEMEFYHSYEFKMNDTTFSKSLLTATLSIENNLLIREDEQYIEMTLETLRFDAIEKKQEEIAKFLTHMNNGHAYISETEINQLIRSMPPEDELYKIDIPLNIVKQIIYNINPDYSVTMQGNTLVIAKDKSYELYEKELPYTAFVQYERHFNIYGKKMSFLFCLIYLM